MVYIKQVYHSHGLLHYYHFMFCVLMCLKFSGQKCVPYIYMLDFFQSTIWVIATIEKTKCACRFNQFHKLKQMRLVLNT